MHKTYCQLNSIPTFNFASDGCGPSNSLGDYFDFHKRNCEEDSYLIEEEDIDFCPEELFMFFEPDYWEL